MKHTSFLSSLAHAFQIPLHVSSQTAQHVARCLPASACSARAPFSTTSTLLKKRNKNAPAVDRRISLLRYFLYHPTTLTPRPLRFGRLRALRHWTIARAWDVHTAAVKRQHQLELERQWTSMRAACEELRLHAGDGGRLYRQALSKKGVWGGRSDLGDSGENREMGDFGKVERGRETGVPIEYARGLVDMPPRTGWDTEWTR